MKKDHKPSPGPTSGSIPAAGVSTASTKAKVLAKADAAVVLQGMVSVGNIFVLFFKNKLSFLGSKTVCAPSGSGKEVTPKKAVSLGVSLSAGSFYDSLWFLGMFFCLVEVIDFWFLCTPSVVCFTIFLSEGRLLMVFSRLLILQNCSHACGVL